MSARNPEHWLWRLGALDWVAAAENELELGRARASSRRSAITHARRAAGMALNGVLVSLADRGADPESCESRWGRSYVDHIRALSDRAEEAPDGGLDPRAAALARGLLEIPVVPGGDLVKLARAPGGDVGRALDLASSLVALARDVVVTPLQ